MLHITRTDERRMKMLLYKKNMSEMVGLMDLKFQIFYLRSAIFAQAYFLQIGYKKLLWCRSTVVFNIPV